MIYFNKLLNWARSTSPWYFQFVLTFCAVGTMPGFSPRQVNIMVVIGRVTREMILRIKKLYKQMANPKYVISMGSCATSRGPYCEHGYHVLRGVDLINLADVYVLGCSPRPVALIDGLLWPT